jgi:hypothetical protein
MRTGSNFLESTLNGVPDLTSHGEAFNPVFVGYPGRADVLGVTLEARMVTPEALYDRIRAAPGLNGFRFFQDHDPRILRRLIADPRCAKIVLTRNALDSYLSLQIARRTGQWKLGAARDRKVAQVTFDPVDFDRFAADRGAFYADVAQALKLAGQAAFMIDYGDLADVAVLNGLLRYLGLSAQLKAPSDRLVRQNPGAAVDKVTNPAALVAALRAGDGAGTAAAVTEGAEARRGAGVPHFVALGGPLPLLFLPVRGGPDAAMRGWMAALGAGRALEEGFSHATLKDWMSDHPAHRKVTVVTHPLVRAWRAWHVIGQSPDEADFRDQLQAQARGGVALPAPGAVGLGDAAATRAGFLSFLRIARQVMSGQAGLRAHALIATQAAIIGGFATVAPPDLILREKTLADDLLRMVRATGHDGAVPPVPAPDPVDAGLAAVADDRLAGAALSAWRRDYVTFGFARGPGRAG